jgi:hypothetical protein
MRSHRSFIERYTDNGNILDVMNPTRRFVTANPPATGISPKTSLRQNAMNVSADAESTQHGC